MSDESLTELLADPTWWIAAPADELKLLLGAALAAGSQGIDEVGHLLIDRVLVTLRGGTRDELLDFTEVVGAALDSDAGDAARASAPAAIAAWTVVHEIAYQAIEQRNPAGAAMVLRSHEKYGLRVLAALADAPEGRLPRGELRKRVGMPKRSDSMLSRLLGDFEDHYLVEREPHGRTVDVVLLPDGRALVDDPARRDALERLAELLEQCIEGRWDDAALADVLAVLGVGDSALKGRLRTALSGIGRALRIDDADRRELTRAAEEATRVFANRGLSTELLPWSGQAGSAGGGSGR